MGTCYFNYTSMSPFLGRFSAPAYAKLVFAVGHFAVGPGQMQVKTVFTVQMVVCGTVGHWMQVTVGFGGPPPAIPDISVEVSTRIVSRDSVSLRLRMGMG